ncbi:hypothetical protein MES4922_190327 [Mesorhizobium ventifaucium]|uniref:Uncharacterized protein n=1 Tax=Mesorhizobium ventifaucium TaxID=666020 RepID=A0ABM9DM53_9HYPH|nr:hypothetical protein MES4922_190327 [Mesorhizobium ventifaucium]
MFLPGRFDQLLGCHVRRHDPHQGVGYRLHLVRVHHPNSLEPPAFAQYLILLMCGTCSVRLSAKISRKNHISSAPWAPQENGFKP